MRRSDCCGTPVLMDNWPDDIYDNICSTCKEHCMVWDDEFICEQCGRVDGEPGAEWRLPACQFRENSKYYHKHHDRLICEECLEALEVAFESVYEEQTKGE